MAGKGSLWLRNGIWHIRYWHLGRSFAETSRSGDPAVARKLLAQRISECNSGKLTGARANKLRFDELAKTILRDYEMKDQKTGGLKTLLNRLRCYFGNPKAHDITAFMINRYKQQRKREGAAKATINRELSVLKRMFHLAVNQGNLAQAPYIEMLREDNAREGFLEPRDLPKILEALPAEYRDPILFLYLTSWRGKEMMSLEWCDVDLVEKNLSLRRENSKNRQARQRSLSGQLLELLQRAYARRIERCSRVFHVDGLQINKNKLYAAWKRARVAAGFPDVLIHDLRRSAIRNMCLAGISEVVAMKLSGHKDRRVFDRYSIVGGEDVRNASLRAEIYLSEKLKWDEDPLVAPGTSGSPGLVSVENQLRKYGDVVSVA